MSLHQFRASGLTGLSGLLCLALLSLAGCRAEGEPAAAARPVTPNENPDMIVKAAVESRTSLSSLTGKGVMRIVDQPSKFGLTVNADVVADESERLRIRADKLAGAVQAFDVVMLGDDVGFYVPTQKTLYHGKVRDLRNLAFRFDPDDVLRQMLRPETSFLLKKWRYAERSRNDPPGAVVLEEATPNGRPRVRLAVDAKTGMLLSVAQLDSAGQPILVKRYDDYRSLARGRKSPKGEGNPVFPYLISFSWPRDRRSLEMHFKAVEGNAVVADEDFDIAASADTRYRPLAEARMDGGM